MFHVTFVKFGPCKKPQESQISPTEAQIYKRKIRKVEVSNSLFAHDLHLNYVLFVSQHDYNCSYCLEDSIS